MEFFAIPAANFKTTCLLSNFILTLSSMTRLVGFTPPPYRTLCDVIEVYSKLGGGVLFQANVYLSESQQFERQLKFLNTLSELRVSYQLCFPHRIQLVVMITMLQRSCLYARSVLPYARVDPKLFQRIY